jgi:CBS domain-containing protein
MLQMVVRDYMTSSVIMLREGDNLHRASVTLAVNGISGAPVVDEEEHLLGIVSSADILRYIRDFRDKLDMECPALIILSTPFDQDIKDPDLREAHRRISVTTLGDIMTR